ncbi:MAG: phospholipase D-like domain-containing protein [Rhodomicrobiaceae bacterium]
MAKIIRARAYCNNEVGYIAWDVDGPIKDSYGFQVTRIHLDDGIRHKKGERRILPAWVAFKGQSNPKWIEQDTSVWPIQGLFWRDLTLRRLRGSLGSHELGMSVRYEIRAVGPRAAGKEDVPVLLKKTYDGDPVPLSYYSDPALTNDITVTDDFGPIRAAFTNGILSSQWLARQIEAKLDKLREIDPTVHDQKTALLHLIRDPQDPVRKYLTGDVLGFLRAVLDEAKENKGSVLLALYELADKELIEVLLANRSRIRIILSNSARGTAQETDGEGGGAGEADGKGPKVWDAENAPARQKLVAAGVDIQHRMFNNDHIGHNKFAVYLDKDGAARKVLTGSTNWTSNGLCAQSNNAMLITDDKVAGAYRDAWERLHEDALEVPEPLSKATRNRQGDALRQANKTPEQFGLDQPRSRITIWHLPDTSRPTKPPLPEAGPIPDALIPPDLADVFQLMQQAKQAIFFLVFMPSNQGRGSIVESAIAMGQADNKLLVIGAVSDPKVLPNYIISPRPHPGEDKPPRPVEPHLYEPKQLGNISVVQADALFRGDLVADFQAELKSAGHAIIHDKIVVIDPLSSGCVVVTGSHNLGLKASYENDENLVVVKGNRKLAEAYAVHVLDVYDHYKWRARRAEDIKAGFKLSEGAGRLRLSDEWLPLSQIGRQGMQARYFAGSE